MTSGMNHRLMTKDDLGAVRFEGSDSLVPVVVQDAVSGRVLVLAYADLEALETTLRTGFVHFWSRTRRALWKKGETSGNVLALESLWLDCDGDAVLAKAAPAGPTCHTGERTCFGNESAGGVLDRLWQRLDARRDADPSGSYTATLLADENLRLKKLGEETTELVIALTKQDASEIDQEAADLMYHTLVALLGSGRTLDDVLGVLAERAG